MRVLHLIPVPQVDTKADWDSASEIIYKADHPSWKGDPHFLLFLHETFTPSALPLSVNSFGKRVSPCHLALIIWAKLSLLIEYTTMYHLFHFHFILPARTIF